MADRLAEHAAVRAVEVTWDAPTSTRAATRCGRSGAPSSITRAVKDRLPDAVSQSS